MKTFEQIRKFNIVADIYFKLEPTNSQTKLGYAIKKMKENQISKILKEFQSENQGLYYEIVQTVQIDNALTNKDTGAILLTPKGSERPYFYNAEGLKKVLKAEKAFEASSEKLMAEWDPKEYDIKPHIAAEIPETLTEDQKEVFTGFVIESPKKKK